MNLIGMMPFRNESWILELAIRQALKWCDELVLLDHASTDDSYPIASAVAEEFSPRVHILLAPDAKWDEMRHRQILYTRAIENGASHVAIIDADEVLTDNLVPVMREHAERLGEGQILQLPGFNLRGGWQYHENGVWGNRWFSTVFRVNDAAFWGGDKFHAREPAGVRWAPVRPFRHPQGGTLHFWGFDEDRLAAKHALYKVTERIRWPEKPVHEIDALYSLAIHGRPHGSDSPMFWTYAPVPNDWLPEFGPKPHGEPWQIAEVRRLVTMFGAKHFAGLDLFGIA